MSKPLKKQNKKRYIKSISIVLVTVLVLFLIINHFFIFSFESTHPVQNYTVVYDEDLFFTYEINKYSTSVEISNVTEPNISIGFSLEPSSLSFGMVPTGGNIGRRFLTLNNIQQDKAKILFVVYGNISPMVYFSDNDFYLPPEIVKDVGIMLETNKDTPVGDYSGEINLIVKRSKYTFMDWLL